MIRWTWNDDESIKRRGTRIFLPLAAEADWLTNYGYALRKRRASAIVTWMERSVSLFLSGVTSSWFARTTRDQRPEISANGRGRSRRPYPETRARAEAGDVVVVVFFSFALSRPLYSRPDNLRPLIYATKRSRTRRDLFFARNETFFVRDRGANMRRTRFFLHAFSRTYDNAKDWLVTACHVAIDPRIFHSRSATNVTVSWLLCYLHWMSLT